MCCRNALPMEKNQYVPESVSPPGETLEELLQERKISQMELAERTGLTPKTVNEIIKGKAPITSETALLLERVLAVPARFWNGREKGYREFLRKEDQHTNTGEENEH